MNSQVKMCITHQLLLFVFSWMGRTVIEFPLEEIASFIADLDTAPLYDKYISVSCDNNGIYEISI